MTVQECYEAFEGNYQEVVSRLRTDERIARFLQKVVDDGSYKLLCDSIETNNVDEAFRAAHTLKGVCGNLSITKFGESSSALCEFLREKRVINDEMMPMFEKVKQDYALTINAIKQLNS
ncbi:MAG: Hpt domain-containing protein [Clostridiales bacterium]|nr:Hpt domain-containing protein [Clostridiales bacterium]